MPLNLRCALLRQQGWTVLSSGSGYQGIRRFVQEAADAVVIDLNYDGSEAALITGELKRLRPEVPVIIVLTDGKELAPGATQQASVVVLKSQETLQLAQGLKTIFRSAGKSNPRP